MNWMSAASFVWKYVIPSLKEIFKILGSDAYKIIKNRVDDAEIMELSGIEKRNSVFEWTKEHLLEKGIKEDDLSALGSVAIYLLIEIAVINLKRKKK